MMFIARYTKLIILMIFLISLLTFNSKRLNIDKDINKEKNQNYKQTELSKKIKTLNKLTLNPLENLSEKSKAEEKYTNTKFNKILDQKYQNLINITNIIKNQENIKKSHLSNDIKALQITNNLIINISKLLKINKNKDNITSNFGLQLFRIENINNFLNKLISHDYLLSFTKKFLKTQQNNNFYILRINYNSPIADIIKNLIMNYFNFYSEIALNNEFWYFFEAEPNSNIIEEKIEIRNYFNNLYKPIDFINFLKDFKEKENQSLYFSKIYENGFYLEKINSLISVSQEKILKENLFNLYGQILLKLGDEVFSYDQELSLDLSSKKNLNLEGFLDDDLLAEKACKTEILNSLELNEVFDVKEIFDKFALYKTSLEELKIVKLEKMMEYDRYFCLNGFKGNEFLIVYPNYNEFKLKAKFIKYEHLLNKDGLNQNIKVDMIDNKNTKEEQKENLDFYFKNLQNNKLAENLLEKIHKALKDKTSTKQIN